MVEVGEGVREACGSSGVAERITAGVSVTTAGVSAAGASAVGVCVSES